MSFDAIARILVVVSLGVTSIFALWRILRGPGILDRMIASDVLLTTVLLLAGVDMVFGGHEELIVLMIAISATGTFATIVVARFVRSKEARERGER